VTAPLLDTHIWLWWITADARLPARVQAVLTGLPGDQRPYVSEISLWEVAMLVERGRIALRVSLERWLELASHPRSVRLVPITPAIAAATAALPSTFHRDPADRLILASCRVLAVPLLSQDDRILRSRLATRWRIVNAG
jgi:PIN domain nuclease of toxin-antitoxin system